MDGFDMQHFHEMSAQELLQRASYAFCTRFGTCFDDISELGPRIFASSIHTQNRNAEKQPES